MAENIKNEITTFVNEEFGEIRTLTEEGKTYFCGADIAGALGYSNSRKALADHCKEKGVTKRDTLTKGGKQELTYIDEGNVYRLITHSKLPDAEKFESWVFDEVLPSIRKTGGYVQQGRENEFLETMFKNMQEQLKDNKSAILALQKQVIAQGRLLDAKPDMYKINTWKKYTGTPAVERLASALGMSKVKKSLYGDIYDAMNEYCGFNKVTAVMDYRAKYHLDEDIEVPPINAVADNPVYQRDFVFTVNKMIIKYKNVEHSVEQSIPVPITPTDRFNAVISPLIELRHDKSAKGAKTLALVYNRMHSKQSWAVMRGKNKCNTNKQLIMKKDSEYDLFCKTVNEMIKEFK